MRASVRNGTRRKAADTHTPDRLFSSKTCCQSMKEEKEREKKRKEKGLSATRKEAITFLLFDEVEQVASPAIMYFS